MPDVRIALRAEDADAWVVTSAGRSEMIVLTDDIVSNYVLVDDPQNS